MLKHIRLFSSFLILSIILLIAACGKDGGQHADPCRLVGCANGTLGPLPTRGDTCICTCTPGFTGKKCDVAIADKWVGSYLCSNLVCKSGFSSIIISVSKNTSSPLKIVIGNLRNSGNNVNADINTSNDSLVIPSQSLTGGTIRGWGKLSSNGSSLSLGYIYTSATSDTCAGTFVKQ